jgi:hypothetical protein
VYTLEFFVKIYAEPRAYWRNNFNRFDFAILLFSYLQFLEELSLFGQIAFLRVLRWVAVTGTGVFLGTRAFEWCHCHRATATPGGGAAVLVVFWVFFFVVFYCVLLGVWGDCEPVDIGGSRLKLIPLEPHGCDLSIGTIFTYLLPL